MATTDPRGRGADGHKCWREEGAFLQEVEQTVWFARPSLVLGQFIRVHPWFKQPSI